MELRNGKIVDRKRKADFDDEQANKKLKLDIIKDVIETFQLSDYFIQVILNDAEVLNFIEQIGTTLVEKSKNIYENDPQIKEKITLILRQFTNVGLDNTIGKNIRRINICLMFAFFKLPNIKSFLLKNPYLLKMVMMKYTEFSTNEEFPVFAKNFKEHYNEFSS